MKAKTCRDFGDLESAPKVDFRCPLTSPRGVGFQMSRRGAIRLDPGDRSLSLGECHKSLRKAQTCRDWVFMGSMRLSSIFGRFVIQCITTTPHPPLLVTCVPSALPSVPRRAGRAWVVGGPCAAHGPSPSHVKSVTKSAYMGCPALVLLLVWCGVLSACRRMREGCGGAAAPYEPEVCDKHSF